MKKHSPNAFTFMEMAIVIMVVSLLVGGIMVGGDLLRKGELRNIMEEKARYLDAIEQFRQIYRALPGDMVSATDRWGAQEADYDDCAELAGPDDRSEGKATCDGNGDDSIYGEAGADKRYHEQFRMWQHLSNAGLIDGEYAGVNFCDEDDVVCYQAGWNAPVSSIRNATWALFDVSKEASMPAYFYDDDDVNFRHIMYFGGEIVGNLHKGGSNPGTYPFGLVLTPKELLNLDEKFDDGRPAFGTIRTIEPTTVTSENNANSCATWETGDNRGSLATDYDSDVAEYNVDNSSKVECIILFPLDF